VGQEILQILNTQVTLELFQILAKELAGGSVVRLVDPVQTTVTLQVVFCEEIKRRRRKKKRGENTSHSDSFQRKIEDP
jgi:hypothetical protein